VIDGVALSASMSTASRALFSVAIFRGQALAATSHEALLATLYCAITITAFATVASVLFRRRPILRLLANATSAANPATVGAC
jgi:hypothetical protein